MSEIPDVLLFTAKGCSHCPSVLHALNELQDTGDIKQLEVIDISEQPQLAQKYKVRSVPWIKIGPFELSGAKSKTELLSWIHKLNDDNKMADYFAELMLSGEIHKVSELINQQASLFEALISLVANTNTNISVRIGAGAVIEEFAGTNILKQNITSLIKLTAHTDPRIRNDACYYLSLSEDALVIPHIEMLLNDINTEVQETAHETLVELKSLA